MELIKKTISNIPFDLHDSRIVKMEVNDGDLTLHLDQVYEYHKDSQKFYPAKLTFTDIYLEECHTLVFDKGIENGEFSGVRYDLQEYLEKYPDAKFEIITDTYNMTTTDTSTEMGRKPWLELSRFGHQARSSLIFKNKVYDKVKNYPAWDSFCLDKEQNL